MQHPARISDVASEAGVSITTVSNVLNRPDIVAAPTRLMVQEAIQRLNFTPNPHATALRRKPKNSPKAPAPVSQSSANPSDARTDSAAVIRDVPVARTRLGQCSTWRSFSEGESVEVIRNGTATVTGIIDAVMADGTALWVWLANGDGRVMLLANDGYHLRKMTENHHR